MGINDHILETCEECELINVLVLQAGSNNANSNFDLVVKRIMNEESDFIRAIEKNPAGVLALYKLTSAEVDFIHGLVLSN